MLSCCNELFRGSFSYVLFSFKNTYRKVEFGICPQCGCLKFKDYKQLYDGFEEVKYYTGKKALQKLECWRKRLNNCKCGTKCNQNLYYGDFQKSKLKDENGNPIFWQLRKNFNGQSEVIGQIKTNIFKE